MSRIKCLSAFLVLNQDSPPSQPMESTTTSTTKPAPAQDQKSSEDSIEIPAQCPQEPMEWCDYICLYRGEATPTSDKRRGLSRVWGWLTGWCRRGS
jgi:hypothetical protein